MEICCRYFFATEFKQWMRFDGTMKRLTARVSLQRPYNYQTRHEMFEFDCKEIFWYARTPLLTSDFLRETGMDRVLFKHRQANRMCRNNRSVTTNLIKFAAI